jgi:hypothetical protein
MVELMTLSLCVCLEVYLCLDGLLRSVFILSCVLQQRVVYYLAVLLEQPCHETTTKKLIPLFQVIIIYSIF